MGTDALSAPVNADPASEGPEASETTREVAGQTTHFLEDGAGPTLFFVHDFLETSVGFAPLVRELGPRYRKVRIDLPGFGKTPVPEGWDYSPAAYGDVLQGALRETAARDATLVLHGFGALVGLRALGRDGGEASRRVSRVILLNSPVYDDGSGGIFGIFRRGAFDALTSFPPTDLPAYRRRLLRQFGDPTYFDEQHAEELYQSWRPSGPRTLRQIAPHLQALRESLPKLRSVFEHWTGPVHVLWGAEDPVLGSETATRFGQEVRRAKVLLFPEVGYLPHEEAPRAVSDQIRKIVRVSRPPAQLPGVSWKGGKLPA